MKICTLKLKTVLILCFLLSSFLPAKVQAQTWYNASWLYRKAITIDFTKVGTGPNTNFPALINITDADLQARALANFNDILFTSADGTTKLAHEVESYTSGTGALVAWVQVPSLSSTANTVIYMYYGNAAATAQQNITGTWNTNFKGVYHLNSGVTDATTVNNGAVTGTITYTGAKIANGGNNFVTGGSNYVTITGLMGNPSPITLSGWSYLTTLGTNGSDIVSLGDHAVIRYDRAAGKYSGAVQTAAGTWQTNNSLSNYALNSWHYVVYTYTSGSQQLYVDGVADGSSTSIALSPYYTGAGTNTIIGKHGNAGEGISRALLTKFVYPTQYGRQVGFLRNTIIRILLQHSRLLAA